MDENGVGLTVHVWTIRTSLELRASLLECRYRVCPRYRCNALAVLSEFIPKTDKDRRIHTEKIYFDFYIQLKSLCYNNFNDVFSIQILFHCYKCFKQLHFKGNSLLFSLIYQLSM